MYVCIYIKRWTEISLPLIIIITAPPRVERSLTHSIQVQEVYIYIYIYIKHK